MKKVIIILFVFTIIFLVGCSTQASNTYTKQNLSDENTSVENKDLKFQNQELDLSHDEIDIMEMPIEFVSNDEIDALEKAIQDEYRAEVIYKLVISEFGDVSPFYEIINSKKTHLNEIKKIYEKYNLTLPENKWVNFDPGFESIPKACEGGVQIEIASIMLYNSLFAQIDNEDIIAVFTTLKNAAQFKRLGAFQKCVARKLH